MADFPPSQNEASPIGSEPPPPPADKPVEPSSVAPSPAATFVGFPKRRYHPVFGSREAKDPNESATIFQPSHDWFDTPEEADMHRTDREAGEAVHYNQRLKVDARVAQATGKQVPPVRGEGAPQGIVRNSVAAQESLNKGNPEPL